jgi:hypothetical protein
MALPSQDAFTVLAHDLAHQLARMGSEADLLALEAVKELERAYGSGPECEAVKSKIMAQRGRLREAHQSAATALRLGRLLTQADSGIHLYFGAVDLSSLLRKAVEGSFFRTVNVSVDSPGEQIKAVCDEELMGIALNNLLNIGFRYKRLPAEAKIRLGRASEDIVIYLPWSTPLRNAPLDIDDLGLLLAERILELHEGVLRRTASEAPTTEVRWPHNLRSGHRDVPLRTSR